MAKSFQRHYTSGKLSHRVFALGVVYIEQTKATWILENGTCCHWTQLDLNLTWCILTILVMHVHYMLNDL